MKPASVITEDLRERIAAEPAEMPFQQIADKYGVTWYHVKNIRLQAGIRAPAPEKKSKKRKKPAACEMVKPSVQVPSGTAFDHAIEAVEEQIALFQAAHTVLQSLRDAAVLD